MALHTETRLGYRLRARTVGKKPKNRIAVRRELSVYDKQNRTRLCSDDFHRLREKIQLRGVVTRECNRIECQ